MGANSKKYSLLPEFHLTTPGLPLHPPIIAENIQIYYRHPPNLSHRTVFCHDKIILIFCYAGTRKVKISSEEYEIRANEVLIIPPFSRHSFPDVDGDYKLVMISFTLAPPNRSVELICSRILPIRAGWVKKIDRCVDSFLEWFGNAPGASNECCYQVSSLLNDLVVRHGDSIVESQTYVNHEQELLKSALNIINRKLDSRLTIKEIAAKLNVSASHLRAICRKYMTDSLGHYIKVRHLNRVQQLLSASDQTLGEIAQQTGYQSESGLIRAYKRETGYTPAAFRNLYREKKMASQPQ